MASTPKLAGLLFFLLFLIQTHARESQFFSKVTRNRDNGPLTTTTASTHEVSSLKNNKEEKEEPSFTPQTSGTGYGLYGHETGLNPPSTTTTSMYNMEDNNGKNYATELKGLSVNGFSNEDNSNTNKFKNNGVEMYYAQGAGLNGGVEKQEISGKSNFYYKESEGVGNYGGVEKQEMNAPTKYDNNNNNYFYESNEEGVGYYGEEEKQGINGKQDYYYKDNEGAGYYGGEEKQGMSAKNHYKYRGNEGAGYYGGVEKQGMSDTRFLESGKYYYDVNAEKNYDTTPNYIPYHGNQFNANYENNYNNYDEYYTNNNNGNAMKGYRNEEQEEDKFFDP